MRSRIKLLSTSYPYWAIHQSFGIPYSDVIAYLESIPPDAPGPIPRKITWNLETWQKMVWLARERQMRAAS